MKLHRQLQPTRGLLSAYYISVLFSTLLFRLDFFQEWVRTGQKFVREIMLDTFKASPTSQDWISWFALFFVCFGVVFIIKGYVVEPIRIFIEDESGVNTWETIFFLTVVFGALIYYINEYFRVPMPSSIFVDTVRQLLGDTSISSISQLRTATVLWNIAPLLVIYLIVRARGGAIPPPAH